MLKAVFLDYTGTITREDGAASMEMVKQRRQKSAGDAIILVGQPEKV